MAASIWPSGRRSPRTWPPAIAVAPSWPRSRGSAPRPGPGRRLRFPAVATAANSATVLGNDVLRRVHAIVDESERRQQGELALRLAEAVREVSAQRQADLVRIDRNIGAMQNNTGREMLRQRNEMLNYV